MLTRPGHRLPPLRLRSAAAPYHSQTTMLGTVISHYHVIKRLGEGGMGEVFLAEDLKLRRLVALKILRSDAASNPEARARLFQEARAASVLNHPNVAVIYEVDETGHRAGALALIALEFVAGESILEHVRRTRPGSTASWTWSSRSPTVSGPRIAAASSTVT